MPLAHLDPVSDGGYALMALGFTELLLSHGRVAVTGRVWGASGASALLRPVRLFCWLNLIGSVALAAGNVMVYRVVLAEHLLGVVLVPGGHGPVAVVTTLLIVLALVYLIAVNVSMLGRVAGMSEVARVAAAAACGSSRPGGGSGIAAGADGDSTDAGEAACASTASNGVTEGDNGVVAGLELELVSVDTVEEMGDTAPSGEEEVEEEVEEEEKAANTPTSQQLQVIVSTESLLCNVGPTRRGSRIALGVWLLVFAILLGKLSLGIVYCENTFCFCNSSSTSSSRSSNASSSGGGGVGGGSYH